MNKRTLIAAALMVAVLIACDSDNTPTGPTAAAPDEHLVTAWQPALPAQPPAGIQPVRIGDSAALDPSGPFTDDVIIDLSAPGDPEVYNFGLGVDLLVGERKQLRTQHGGVDRTNQTTWTTYDASIADFPDRRGRIRGHGAGSTYIKSRWGRYFRTMRVVVRGPDIGNDSDRGCDPENLGAYSSTTLTRNGTLSASCVSPNYSGEYARFYGFSTIGVVNVQIDMTSSDIDPWLTLRRGHNNRGAQITFNNDGGQGRNARITRSLATGDYTIEATSAAPRDAGSFTLRVQIRPRVP